MGINRTWRAGVVLGGAAPRVTSTPTDLSALGKGRCPLLTPTPIPPSTPPIPVLDWHGCYEDSWRDLIVPEAFAHPAKFAPGLIRRIYAHGIAHGWWRKGDTVADPFGGIAGGGIVAGYAGLSWLGVELEARFVELGNRNLELHAPRWVVMGEGVCVRLVQGDSRRFAEIVGEAAAVVTSPPYADVPLNPGEKSRPEAKIARLTAEGKLREAEIVRMHGSGAASNLRQLDYGQTVGQIGALKSGEIDAVLTSPPYAESLKPETDEQTRRKQERIAKSKQMHDGRARTVGVPGDAGLGGGYGISDGQIGALKEGAVDAVITSPPYAESVTGAHAEKETAADSRAARRTPGGSLGQSQRNGGYGVSEGQIGALRDGPVDAVVTSPPFESVEPYQDKSFRLNDGRKAKPQGQDGYGGSDGQIGNDTGETYWQAMAQVYAQCLIALRPGGICCVVIKDYIQKKQRVPLCDQTLRLLTHLGFEPVERIRAWLVREERSAGLWGEHVKKKERKSFFRRLCEARGSPRIDWEEVLVLRKPYEQVQGLQTEVDGTWDTKEVSELCGEG